MQRCVSPLPTVIITLVGYATRRESPAQDHLYRTLPMTWPNSRRDRARALPSALLTAALACALLAVSAASAQAVKPVVISFHATPRSLSASGGVITFTGHVSNAASCIIYTDFGRPVRVGCRSGHFTLRRRLPANTGAYPDLYLAYVVAYSGHQNTRSRDAQVEVLLPSTATPSQPATTAPPPVVNLDVCSPGPECDYGAAAYEQYENWGNTAPESFGDCTFAAAADWEQILFHWRPYPTALGFEFAQAGGNAETGLPQTSLWHYWEKDGIAGSYLTGLHSYYATVENVHNGVRDYAAMIIELRFYEGWYFGQYRVGNGQHDAVVMGFTPEGPLVVSWGQVLQMTWEQWNAEVIGMWGIGATNPNPS